MTEQLRIGIVGATSPLSGELKEALAESALAGATFVLLDDAEAQGTLDQVGDEAAIVLGLGEEAFDGLDFVFFAGSSEQTRRWWRRAADAGTAVLDMTGVLDAEPGVVIGSPWLRSAENEPDLLTRAMVPAHAGALAIAAILNRLHVPGLLRTAAVTVLHPASEFGTGALEELHRQTVSVLNFQNLPQDVFGAQVAFNQMVELGDAARASLHDADGRLRHHLATMLRGADVSMQMVQAPVFHGICLSIWVELTRAVPRSALEQALNSEPLQLVPAGEPAPSNQEAIGQDLILLRLAPPDMGRGEAARQDEVRHFWLWAACDNLRLAARNAVDCALEMRRLRPRGQVQ